ncbi:YeeE/YedE family protein [Vibrio cincinnatiensis]|uniref:YeeE/YedE family protein n=1 Tax=Vibrio cincinnatiensis TaxID=675 RepID=UPI001EE0AB7F|nr:YeeE/YedE family protein [Vibrio cincinnatiensis]MCG3732118.1 YeeE/YedE family protein [Vibrio cincinnatiensis]MCG3739829.1 YeeE/YedE family protein [Vibrio cincinnatiensis]
MNKILFQLTALFSGLLFGIGMVISGMANPTKVIGFLDITGAWDPSLIFVMGGALLVFMPAYFLLIKPKQKPLNAPEFCLAKNSLIDSKLLMGALLFGLGWGIAGICPGPAVSSLALGNPGVWVFFISMMVGLGVMNRWIKVKNH